MWYDPQDPEAAYELDFINDTTVAESDSSWVDADQRYERVTSYPSISGLGDTIRLSWSTGMVWTLGVSADMLSGPYGPGSWVFIRN